MNCIKETFSENGVWSSKRVLGGIIFFAVVAGWLYSVWTNGLGTHETDLAETLVYVAGVLVGITPVADAIKGARTRRNGPGNDERNENV